METSIQNSSQRLLQNIGKYESVQKAFDNFSDDVDLTVPAVKMFLSETVKNGTVLPGSTLKSITNFIQIAYYLAHGKGTLKDKKVAMVNFRISNGPVLVPLTIPFLFEDYAEFRAELRNFFVRQFPGINIFYLDDIYVEGAIGLTKNEDLTRFLIKQSGGGGSIELVTPRYFAGYESSSGVHNYVGLFNAAQEGSSITVFEKYFMNTQGFIKKELYDALQQTHNNLEADHKKKLAKLILEKDTLDDKINELNKKLMTGTTELSKEFEETKEKLANITAELIGAKDQNAELALAIELLKKKLLQKPITVVNPNESQDIKKLKKEIEELKSSIQKAEAEPQPVDESGPLKTQLKELADKLDVEQSKVSDGLSKLDKLTQKIAANEKEIENLKTQNHILKTLNEDLQEKHTDGSATENELEALKLKVEEHLSTIEMNAAQIVKLNQDIIMNRNTLTTKDAELKDLRDKLAEIKTNLDEKNQKLIEMKKLYDDRQKTWEKKLIDLETDHENVVADLKAQIAKLQDLKKEFEAPLNVGMAEILKTFSKAFTKEKQDPVQFFKNNIGSISKVLIDLLFVNGEPIYWVRVDPAHIKKSNLLEDLAYYYEQGEPNNGVYSIGIMHILELKIGNLKTALKNVHDYAEYVDPLKEIIAMFITRRFEVFNNFVSQFTSVKAEFIREFESKLHENHKDGFRRMVAQVCKDITEYIGGEATIVNIMDYGKFDGKLHDLFPLLERLQRSNWFKTWEKWAGTHKLENFDAAIQTGKTLSII